MTKPVASKSGAKQVKKPNHLNKQVADKADVEALALTSDKAAPADHREAAPASGAKQIAMANGPEFSAALAQVSAGRAASDQVSGGVSALGGSAALPILGGLVVAGGVAALAAGGGSKNAAPTVAATQAVSGTEDKPVAVTVAATDTNNDTLTYTASTPANGTVAVAGNVVTYTPKANFNGTDTFNVTVADGKGGTATQAVTVAVAAVNDAPVFADATKAVSTNEDTAATVALAATDADSDTLTYAASTPAHGTVSISGGNATYTPAKDYNGTDSFTLTASDGKGGTATQTVNLTVAAVNDAPVIGAAATKTITVAEDGSAAFDIDATDVDSATLTPSITTAPAHGAISVVGGKNTYTPVADYHGADSFEVGVSDGTTTTKYTVNVTVSSVGEVVSIDTTNDATATTYNAAVDKLGVADTFKFTDDSAKATNAIITNMTSGDVVEVTGASSNYSFSSVGNDILISYNNTGAGVLNQIKLVGLAANAGTVLITDERSAEAVAGFDFFNALTQPNGNGSGDGVAGVNGNLDDDNDANPLTVASIGATAGADAFTENANVANTAKIVGFGAGDTITVSNASTSAYSFTSVGTDLHITYSHDGVVNDITLAGVLSANTFIASELDAETALGRDFFRDSTFGTTGTNSLDVGTDVSRASLSGASGAVTFTDAAGVSSNVRISNFGIDDLIRVTGATAAQYSFSSGDVDGDGSADDLSIVYNAGSGVLNDIQILNVVSPTDFVFDKASAVAAVGFNFITFG